MVVGQQRDVTLDDRQVVLGVGRAGVLALAELRRRPVVADAHDRRPRPVAHVVGVGVVAVVAEPEGVAGLVRGGLGDALERARARAAAEKTNAGVSVFQENDPT